MTRQLVRNATFIWAVSAIAVTGCRAQREGDATPRPEELVIWEDPDGNGSGTTVRDANNDPTRFVAIGSNGSVQFSPGENVCNDCETDIDNATIDVQGNLIDIRFGVGTVGDDESRRPFLVDRQSGNFVQLVGGGDGGNQAVEFQVTDTAFENPNDATDDRAVAGGTIENPALAAEEDDTPSLCGLFGTPALILMFLAPALLRRRRWL